MPKVTSLDGPVAVTGASGYVGSQVVAALVRRGYDVRACVTDGQNPRKTEHLLSLNVHRAPGRAQIHVADLLAEGSYDEAVAGCSAVLHAGTPIGRPGVDTPRQVHDGAVHGTENLLRSVQRSGSVRRFVYTSSFSAIVHPAPPGYQFTELDWASDSQGLEQMPEPPGWLHLWQTLVGNAVPSWNDADIESSRNLAYAKAKVATEQLVYRTAEQAGSFDAISVCPLTVLGPLLSRAHCPRTSWQGIVGRILSGEPCERWMHLWNIVDVRDVAEAQALILESSVCRNGDRYQLTATDESGELDAAQLQARLARLFPQYPVGGAPEGFAALIEQYGGPYAWRAHCDKARRELGLQTHDIDDTLQETGRTIVELGLLQLPTQTT
jgi:nucleoside-diphosphate-sugar epimerase